MLTLGNRNFKEEIVSWPEPLEFVKGTITYTGNEFARVRGWTELHFKLAQTNMVQPIFYLKDGDPVFAKDVIRLDKRKYWVDDWFKNWLGDFMWGKYCQPSFGWQDTNNKPTDPITGEFKQQTIDSGCNLRKTICTPFWTRKGQFIQIEAVDYLSRPDQEKVNYKLTPHLITKQAIASVSQVEKVAYITHQKHGDLVWPNLFTHSPILPISTLEFFPKLPFETKYLGETVTLTGFCFQASKVFGLFPDGWRAIEESVISGIGSAYYDRKVYVDKWLVTPPPTIKGFTQEKNSKFDWQI